MTTYMILTKNKYSLYRKSNIYYNNAGEKKSPVLFLYVIGKVTLKGDNMRIDKFLKVSRIIKRRTVANEACDAGRVMVNGKPAKASVNVKVGDIIEIAFGTKSVKVRVLNILDTTKKEEAKDLFSNIRNLFFISMV